MGRCGSDHQLAGAVQVQPGVPIDVADLRKPDDEGRVGHDLVELAPLHGFEPRALQQLHLQAVQREGGPGHRQGSGADVGGGDRGGMAGGMHGLDAAAGAQVQHRSGRRRWHGAQQRHRGLADPGDISTVVEPRSATRVEVGDHPPAAEAGVQRAHVQRRPHSRACCLEQARCHRRRQRERGQRGCDLRRRAGVAEQEQPHQGGERTAVANDSSDRGHLSAPQRRMRVFPEQRQDTVGVVAGAIERLPQRSTDRQQLGERRFGHAGIVPGSLRMRPHWAGGTVEPWQSKDPPARAHHTAKPC